MTAHTSYAAAKFAVKGFTEAMITDLRLHAPHVQFGGHARSYRDVNCLNTLVGFGKATGMDLTSKMVATVRERMLAWGCLLAMCPMITFAKCWRIVPKRSAPRRLQQPPQRPE